MKYLKQFRIIFEGIEIFENYVFDEDYYEYNNKQSYVRITMCNLDNELLAKANYVIYENKVYISFIESIVKKQGYGVILMKYLSKIYGYENIIRSGLTNDGVKMRKKLDDFYNFDFEEHQKSLNKHLDKSVLDRIKDERVKNFLLHMVNCGYTQTWDLWRDTEDFNAIRNIYDLNDISYISEWIKDSKTNENDPQDYPPGYVLEELKKLY